MQGLRHREDPVGHRSVWEFRIGLWQFEAVQKEIHAPDARCIAEIRKCGSGVALRLFCVGNHHHERGFAVVTTVDPVVHPCLLNCGQIAMRAQGEDDHVCIGCGIRCFLLKHGIGEMFELPP